MSQRGNTGGAEGPSSAPIYKDLVLLQLVALVVLLDQFSKFLVRELLSFQDSFPEEGFFRITHTYNTGGAFGVFQGQNGPLILASFVGITILFLIYRSQARLTNPLRLSLGLQMGGAVGNLLDRVRLGHVTDFIDIGPWPVFNLADAFIVCGLVLLVWLFLGPRRVGDRRPATEARQPLHRDGYSDGYSWCPVCDGAMLEVPSGWRCSRCGAQETVDRSASVPVTPAGPGPDSGEIAGVGPGSDVGPGPSQVGPP